MTGAPSQFEPELREFDAAEAPSNAVVFYGSSSLRLWDDLAERFPGRTVVNRGFGGSTLAECIDLLPRVVFPLKPAALVLYAGDNDLDQGCSPEHVVYLFSRFMTRLREHFPSLPVAFVSVKPSPCRFWNIANIRRANGLMQEAIAAYPGVTYLDVFTAMLSASGGSRPELFTEDGLHMNSAGYDQWTWTIRQWLEAAQLGLVN